MSDELVRQLLSEGGSQLISVAGSVLTTLAAAWVKSWISRRKAAATTAAAEPEANAD